MEILRLVLYILFIMKSSSIILKNGGYEDVYVLIHENNNESAELIQRIKHVLTSASQLLFTATHNQVYFREIKIVVPKTWSQKQKFKQLPTPPLKDSYFSVDSDGPDTPQAIGQFMCGKAGQYVHLSPKFLMNKERTSWGLHDRVIVHEWGHLRWGLFNELPTKGNQFYLANGKWNPTRCTDEIKGKISFKPQYKESEECDINDTSKPMHKNCTFIPSSNQNVDASLMSYPYIDKLTAFCDKDNATVKKEHLHQRFAPTLHNKECNHRSAWEVMRLHSDFQNATQLPGSTNTTPAFEVIQETTNYRVFVLDVSGSMNQFERLKTLQQAIKNVIQQLISKGSWVGIISFSTTAKVERDLTEVNTQQDRETLINAIPTKTSGYTCIGCGLREATKVLTEKLGGTAYGEIILISDGENSPDNVDVDVNIARQEVVAAKITVHTIAVSQQADHLLGDIARETGGKYYTYLDNGGISLLGAFSQSLSSAQTSSKKKTILLMANKMDTVNSTQHNISFAIEEGLGDDTTFTFVTPTDTDVQLQLMGPNDYNQFIKSHGTITTLSIPGTAQAGEYEMMVTTDTIPRTVEYYVKSGATSGDIVRVTSLLSTNDIDLSTGDLPIIYSQVSKGYLPVLNATVTAHVETDTNACDVSLKDDGIDPDSFSKDGIYSGYILPNCLHSGRVNVKVDVKGTKGETKVLQSVTGAPSEHEAMVYNLNIRRYPCAKSCELQLIDSICRLTCFAAIRYDKERKVDERTEVYDSSFQRVEMLEQLLVTKDSTSDALDLVAPGKITDVSIHYIHTKVSSKEERRNFTISWTATGNDKSLGRAARYIFRIADDIDDLLYKFDNATMLEVTNGSLIPKQSGETEVLTIVVDAEESFTGTAFFAVQAVDETGNKGSVSNIVSIIVAKGYRTFAEEGTLDIDIRDMASCAGCFHVLFLLVIASICFHFT